jgi:hypothetical protein
MLLVYGPAALRGAQAFVVELRKHPMGCLAGPNSFDGADLLETGTTEHKAASFLARG